MLLQDIDKDTVNWAANFDDTLKEPAVLPAVLPNLLVNGASGIAVGMATNIPPHNLGEIIDAIAYTIDNWDGWRITVDELMQFVKGPDFPTGGIIMGMDGIGRPMRPVVAVFDAGGARSKRHAGVSASSSRRFPTNSTRPP